MKICIACDDLTQFGGQESLVIESSKHLKGLGHEVTILASCISKKWQQVLSHSELPFKVTALQRFPLIGKLIRFYAFLYLPGLFLASQKLAGYDVVLSFSARFAHLLRVATPTSYIVYLNSPPRMFWEYQDYFDKELRGLLRYFYGLMTIPFMLYRMYDYVCIHQTDKLVVNSRNVARKVSKYYGIKAEVIYPFYEVPNSEVVSEGSSAGSDYYLIISRLVAWKKIDIAVEAFKHSGRKLVIVGYGRDKARLERLAAHCPNIVFSGYVSSLEKATLLKNCRALICTQEEDFGITPLEAMHYGRPVVAFRAGGYLETVIENTTGVFFEKQEAKSLLAALEHLETLSFDSSVISACPKKFSKQIFLQNLVAILNADSHR